MRDSLFREVNSVNPCLETLPETQKSLYASMGFLRSWCFVLYGGTSLALRFGHRISEDFDFFTHLPFNKKEKEWVISSLESFGWNPSISQNALSTLSLTIQGVKLSFFGEISFGRLGSPQETLDGILELASPEDLLALKLGVITQRAHRKDYEDLAALFRRGYSLQKGLEGALRIFGENHFSPISSLRALAYFDDGDLKELSDEARREIFRVLREMDIQGVELKPAELAGTSLSAFPPCQKHPPGTPHEPSL